MNLKFKYIIFAMLVISTFWISNFNSFADEDHPCADCPNIEWVESPEWRHFYPNNCPNCTLTVNYSYRYIDNSCPTAQEGIYDIQIKDIWRSPGCDLCFNIKEIQKIAVDSLLIHNDIVEQGDPADSVIYRFFQSSCWGEWWSYDDNRYVFRGCLPDEQCCIEKYKVRYENGQLTEVEKVLSYNPNPMVEYTGCDKWTTACYFVCDSALSPPPPPLLQSIKGVNSFFYSSVNPNFNDGSFILQLSDELLNSQIMINFHNINGVLIYQIPLMKVSNTEFPIDLKQHPVGTYYYNIIKESKVIDTGIFIKI